MILKTIQPEEPAHQISCPAMYLVTQLSRSLCRSENQKQTHTHGADCHAVAGRVCPSLVHKGRAAHPPPSEPGAPAKLSAPGASPSMARQAPSKLWPLPLWAGSRKESPVPHHSPALLSQRLWHPAGSVPIHFPPRYQTCAHRNPAAELLSRGLGDP